MAEKNKFSEEKYLILQAAEEKGIRTPVLKWLSNPANLDKLPPLDKLGHITHLVDIVGDYKISETVFGWLHDFRNTEQAAKSWYSFGLVFLEKVGIYKIANPVFGWLKNPRNTEQAAKDWFNVGEVVSNAGVHKIADIVFAWLSNPLNTEQAAKNWEYFAKVVYAAGEYKIADIVFNRQSNPLNTEQAAKNWGGFAHVLECAGEYKIADIVFAWLSNPLNTEQAAKNWSGFARAVEVTGKNGIAPLLFTYLSSKQMSKNELDRDVSTFLCGYMSDPLNVEKASQNWDFFAERLNDEKCRGDMFKSVYFARVYTWFEKNNLILSDKEKQNLVWILETRKKVKKNIKQSAQQILRYLPPLRKKLDTIKDEHARSFVLRHAMFYEAVSHYPPDKFKEFVDSLESSKKRAAEMKRLGIKMQYWNNYTNEKKIPISGKKSEPMKLEEIVSTTSHFQKCINTKTKDLAKTAAKLTGEKRNEILSKIEEAQLVQNYAKKQNLLVGSEKNKQGYIQKIYRYYAEKDNWKHLPETITKNYGSIEQKLKDLLERFGYEGAIIKLCVSAWSRKLPDDIAIANACGDCTCTSGKYAEEGSTRLADNGYSILKIYSLNGSKTHIGNSYCMAYTANGNSCLVIDGIEITQSFGYGSPEVAEGLVELVREYAKECNFKEVVINSYPSNIAWIKGYVEGKYKKIGVNLHKIGGTEHLKELGLEGAKVLAEGKIEVFKLM